MKIASSGQKLQIVNWRVAASNVTRDHIATEIPSYGFTRTNRTRLPKLYWLALGINNPRFLPDGNHWPLFSTGDSLADLQEFQGASTFIKLI